MANKRRPADPDPFGDLVVDAFMATTAAQREQVVTDWEYGRKMYHIDVASLLGLDSDALRLAAFLEHGHPSVCSAGGPKGKNYGKLREMMLKYVDNNDETVDNSCFSVDNSVDEDVDESEILLHSGALSTVSTEESVKLSTYPQFIHNPLVDNLPCF